MIIHINYQKEAPIMTDFENKYLDGKQWVDTFSIPYDDLRNDDGSPLTSAQRATVVAYLKKNSIHADDNHFRFANNNFEVLAGARTKSVWKLMHNYLRRLSCLMQRLKGNRFRSMPSK